MEIKLKHPVTVAGEEVKALRLRRPKVKDQLAADKGAGGNAEKEIRLFANLCEVAPAIIEELDLADYRQVQEAYSAFLS
ncbi:phage tail assembly protein [Geoalkalibacter halelectricus]|uniref:phage tail assembly protein n=1 Tax=Geoalkalibacter halelectricus TaxID=2847045 RepID=UPI003D257C3F